MQLTAEQLMGIIGTKECEIIASRIEIARLTKVIEGLTATGVKATDEAAETQG